MVRTAAVDSVATITGFRDASLLGAFALPAALDADRASTTAP